MSSKIYSAAIIGLDSSLIEVEADISNNPNAVFTVVGLPDTSVQEARERVRAAIKNSGFRDPRTRSTINLAPADLRKEGTGFDLPIAISLMVAADQLELPEDNKRKLFVGELALNGDVRPINGVLPIAMLVRSEKISEFYVPQDNVLEAKLIPGIKVFPVKTLNQLAEHLKGLELIKPVTKVTNYQVEEKFGQTDMCFVCGQEQAKRALEIAAAGHHNVRLVGPPGSGKTLLAQTLPSILPLLDLEEALEVTKVYSVAGLVSNKNPLIQKRPFRRPHHTASTAALVGGGRIPHPGEISLAHRGVLFLDEFSEFPRPVLEALRQPLEDRTITVARTQSTLQFPANFILIASQNPCPCGYLNDPQKECTCTPMQIIKYRKKISGPLLDRIDMHIEVPRVKFEKLITARDKIEKSEKIRQRVKKARAIQKRRFKHSATLTNSEMNQEELENFCVLDNDGKNLMRQAVNQLHLSARGYHRILKLSRTIADLAESEDIITEHIAEALQYRPKENY